MAHEVQVNPHVVQRFKERVFNFSDEKIIRIVKENVMCGRNRIITKLVKSKGIYFHSFFIEARIKGKKFYIACNDKADYTYTVLTDHMFNGLKGKF